MIDILVVVVYFTFLITIGWLFRSYTSSTSDYFRGGGKMLWWMVGATAFMTQFSAWTFTGAAGKAFKDGWSVVVIFLANTLGYFCNYLFFAEKARQMRVVTPIEGIRMRYGKLNEQIFTCFFIGFKYTYNFTSFIVFNNDFCVFRNRTFFISCCKVSRHNCHGLYGWFWYCD